MNDKLIEEIEKKMARILYRNGTAVDLSGRAQAQCAALARAAYSVLEDQGVRKAAQALSDAMESCHICGGTVYVGNDSGGCGVHCEDCSRSCDEHPEPECVTIYELHRRLKVSLTSNAATNDEMSIVSSTYGDLARYYPIIAEWIEPHEWDNKTPSEQRDWVLVQLAALYQ